MLRLAKLGSKILLSNFSTLTEPYKLTFAITYKCNSRCVTCGIWKKKERNELTTEEIKRIFEHISPAWVNLTGGEPFLRTDLHEIASFAGKAYMLNLTTNGILVDRILKVSEKISKLGFPKFVVVVSLDGPEKIHDKIRGVKGNWKKAVETFLGLKELERKRRNFKTFFGYTISKYNVGLIEKTIEEVRKEAEVTVNDFHFNIYHTSFYYANKKEGILKEKFLKDVNYVLRSKGKLGVIPFIESRYMKLVKKYLETGKSPLPCKALTSSCFVDPEGNVYPCTIFNKKLGNLREVNYDLKKLWNSSEANLARKLIKENSCPGCWTPCEAYQTILGNLLRILNA